MATLALNIFCFENYNFKKKGTTELIEHLVLQYEHTH